MVPLARFVHVEIEDAERGHLHQLPAASADEEIFLPDFEDAHGADVALFPVDAAREQVELVGALQNAMAVGDRCVQLLCNRRQLPHPRDQHPQHLPLFSTHRSLCKINAEIHTSSKGSVASISVVLTSLDRFEASEFTPRN